MKQCLNLSSNKSDEAKIKFFEKAIKEKKIDGSYIRNRYGEIELNCISDESCNQCNFEEHCYFGIRKLSKDQFFMLADKFPEIKKVNESDIKFGTVVKLQTRLLKIQESKLQYLRIIYGRCLSEKQINKIKSDLYEDDSHDNNLSINYTDLETVDNRVLTGIVSGINSFGYYFNEYSEHSKTFAANNSHCVHYVNRPNFILDKLGKDFEDHSIWTVPEIIEILSPEESQKYLEKHTEFYSNLNKIN